MALLMTSIAAGAVAAGDILLRDGYDGYAGTADASIYADYPDNANGGYPFLFSGSTVNSVRRALIRFDLSHLSVGTNATTVTLTLVLDRSGLEAGNDVYTLHRVLSPWGEGTASEADGSTGGIGVDAGPGDATWASSQHPETPWATAGGDYDTSPSASMAIGRWDSIRPENNVYTFTDPLFRADVQHWLRHPEQNHGWILLGNEVTARNARRFHSSESPEMAARPSLRLLGVTTTTDRWSIH